MDTASGSGLPQAAARAEAPLAAVPVQLARAFSVIVVDWDGTAVRDRHEDASALRARIRALLARGVDVVIVTGTHLLNITRQLGLEGGALPEGRLFAATNRGSELYGFDGDARPERLWMRQATDLEDRLLDRVADRLKRELEARTGLSISVVSNRMNRRKIDLIATPEWSDPPKARLADLEAAVEARLAGAGLAGGLAEALAWARRIVDEEGFGQARLTSDVKHIEIGLTDKGDAMAWVMDHLVPARALAAQDVLVGGDEFGPIAGMPGSDAKMAVASATGATFVSVGPEPGGVPKGVLHLGGGPARFGELLADQATRARPALPAVFVPTLDAAWCLTEPGHDPMLERTIAARLALGNGYAGHRAGLGESADARGETLVAGVYNPGSDGVPELVVAPSWHGWRLELVGEPLQLEAGEILSHRRMLDLRRGVLLRAWRHRTPMGRVVRLMEARWLSMADRHAFMQQLFVVPENFSGEVRLVAELDGHVRNEDGRVHLRPSRTSAMPVPLLAMHTDTTDIALAYACAVDTPCAAEPSTEVEPGRIVMTWRRNLRLGEPLELHRATAVYTSRDVADPVAAARRHAGELRKTGTAANAIAHARAWRSLWNAADVQVEGDPAAQRALRFALYHLLAAANPDDRRVSVPARGLTGQAYRGHVFWDTDAYILPFYVHAHPAAARALVGYRHHTLEAARTRARALGYRGALHAWESADTGADETPSTAIGPGGGTLLIRTGRMEHHIEAAVGHAVWHYWQSTGDDVFFREAGAELLLEGARFWASRAEPDARGRWHVRHVIGPDEYHEDVDDNAYTNVMAAWLLRRGGDAARALEATDGAAWRALSRRLALSASELAAWEAIAAGMVDGFDPETGLYEQFAGFYALTQLDLSAYPRPGTPVDLLLGHEVVQGAQVIKQADVVMLMHMLEPCFPLGVRRANYRYYEPRTAHGSSLSPGAHAYVAARIGDLAEAMRQFRLAASIDLDDRWGNAAGGVHMAAFGCLWQTVAHGFAGAMPMAEGLRLAPSLPPTWRSLTLPLQYREWRLRLRAEPLALTLSIDGPRAMPVWLGEQPPRWLVAGTHRATRLEGAWRWQPPT